MAMCNHIRMKRLRRGLSQNDYEPRTKIIEVLQLNDHTRDDCIGEAVRARQTLENEVGRHPRALAYGKRSLPPLPNELIEFQHGWQHRGITCEDEIDVNHD